MKTNKPGEKKAESVLQESFEVHFVKHVLNCEVS